MLVAICFLFRFTLPGGNFKAKDEEVINLPPIKGTLSAWGGLTAALAQTLEELQSGGLYTFFKHLKFI